MLRLPEKSFKDGTQIWLFSSYPWPRQSILFVGGIKIPPPIYTGVETICVLLLHQSGGLPSLSDEKREEEGRGGRKEERRAFPHYRNKSGSWLALELCRPWPRLSLHLSTEHDEESLSLFLPLPISRRKFLVGTVPCPSPIMRQLSASITGCRGFLRTFYNSGTFSYDFSICTFAGSFVLYAHLWWRKLQPNNVAFNAEEVFQQARGSRKARAQGNDGTAAPRDSASIVVGAGELTWVGGLQGRDNWRGGSLLL